MFEIAYLSLSLVVGLLAMNMRGGFLLWFLMALVLTPPGALLVIIILTTRFRFRRKAKPA